MIRIIYFPLLLSLLIFGLADNAGADDLPFDGVLISGDEDSSSLKKEDGKTSRNYLKLNLAALPLKNYGIQYKRVLDLWFPGPHGGTVTGILNAQSPNLSLSPSEQEDLRQSIEDVDIPFVKKEVEVSAHQVKAKITGPWIGFRTGISLGFHF